MTKASDEEQRARYGHPEHQLCYWKKVGVLVEGTPIIDQIVRLDTAEDAMDEYEHAERIVVHFFAPVAKKTHYDADYHAVACIQQKANNCINVMHACERHQYRSA